MKLTDACINRLDDCAKAVVNNGYKPTKLLELNPAVDQYGLFLGRSGPYRIAQIGSTCQVTERPAQGVTLVASMPVQRFRRGISRGTEDVFPVAAVGFWKQNTIWETVGEDGERRRFIYKPKGYSTWSRRLEAQQALTGRICCLCDWFITAIRTYNDPFHPDERCWARSDYLRHKFSQERCCWFRDLLSKELNQDAAVLTDELIDLQFELGVNFHSQWAARNLCLWEAKSQHVLVLSDNQPIRYDQLQKVEDILNVHDNLVERVQKLLAGSPEDRDYFEAPDTRELIIEIQVCRVHRTKDNPDHECVLV